MTVLIIESGHLEQINDWINWVQSVSHFFAFPCNFGKSRNWIVGSSTKAIVAMHPQQGRHLMVVWESEYEDG